MSIEALIIDDEGYLAGAPGGEYVFGTFLATLSANVEARPTSAVAFVSDRSGSMSGTAGGGFTRFQLLEEALEVATDLLEAADSAALVFFDDTVMTPLGMSTIGGGGAVAAALANPAIQPAFGSTAIGAGLIAGAAEFNAYVPPPAVTNPNLAILCLTDGNENVPPNVSSAAVANAISAYGSDVYAIGLGTEDNVSASTLGAISQYMLVTGDRTADQRRFMVTKYFVQILADIKKNAIIVDPDGILHAGVTHEVPFDVSEADVETSIILLSPAAPWIDFEVVTPGGDVLSRAAPGPNASLEVNRLDAVLRLTLPALPSSPATSHAGRWRLRLRLDTKATGALRERLMALATTDRVPAIEYSVVVQARSNLVFRVGRTSPHIAPGDTMPVVATLTQYRVAHLGNGGRARHRAGRVQQPAPARPGCDEPLRSLDPGARARRVHAARRRARHHNGGVRFTRETTRTFAVGKPGATPSGADPRGDRPPALCSLLDCLLHDAGARRWMVSRGIDVESLHRCLKEACAPRKDTMSEPDPKRRAKAAELSADELAKAIRRAIDMASADPLAVPEPEPLPTTEFDPSLFEVPMFMPALARTKTGEIVLAMTGKAPPPRGDPAIPVARLRGISAAAAKNSRRRASRRRATCSPTHRS